MEDIDIAANQLAHVEGLQLLLQLLLIAGQHFIQ